jgi:outer membrane receptor protein involved in Fe transport
VDVTLQRNVVDFIIGPVIGQAAEVITDQHEPNLVWTGRATWTPNPKTLVELRTGGLDYLQTVDPRNGGRTGTPSRLDLVTGIRSGNTLNWRTLDEKRYSGGVNLTRFVVGFLGLHHELKTGVEFHHYDFFVDQGYTGGASFSDRNGVPDQVELWPGDVTEATGNQTRAFVQDSWRVTDRITLEPGLRFTSNRGTTPTTGPVYSTTYVSPRLGVAWDVTPDHKTVVRAHYGLYHEAFGTISYQYTDTDGATPRITARVLPGGQFQEVSRFTPAGNQVIDEDITQPHYRQFVAGVEREVFSDFSAKVQYIHRTGQNLFGWEDPVTVYAPVQLRDPGPDNRPGTADDGDLFTLFNVTNPGQEKRVYTNPEGATRKYRALQLVVQKRFSHNWQMLAGYTYSKAEGTLDNNQTDNYGRSQAPQTPFFNPNVAINYAGRNSIDFPHQLILRGSYRLPLWGGFNFGASYRYISGQPYSRTAVFRLAQGNQQVRVAPRGEFSNESTGRADVRVDKSFSIGGQRSISAYLDVFNVNNEGVPTGVIEASGATFGQPAGWSSPRTYLLGARLSF